MGRISFTLALPPLLIVLCACGDARVESVAQQAGQTAVPATPATPPPSQPQASAPTAPTLPPAAPVVSPQTPPSKQRAQTPSTAPLLELDGDEVSRLVRERPFVLHVPQKARSEAPSPLVVFLHGYGASGPRLQEVLEVKTLANARGFVAAIPEGTKASDRRRFWNATPACCNFEGSSVDDVRYLLAVIDNAIERAPVDRERVYVVGFSNGGFMAHRLACELSHRIAAVASIAGMTFMDEDRCRPAQPIALLQVHGDTDDIVPYLGGHALGRPELPPHPSARESVARWAAHNGCSVDSNEGTAFDLEPRLDGAETRITAHRDCTNGNAELWTVRGGNHFVALRREAAGRIYEWLLQQRLQG